MKLGTKLTVAFVLGLLIIGAVGIRSYLAIQRLTETNRWVVHTHVVLEKLEHVQLMLTNAETGARGFVLTGEEPFLAPHNAAAAEISKDIASVKYLTQDNPEQQRDVEQLEKLSREKLDVLQGFIERRKEAGLEAALPIIRSGQGAQIMDDIRALVAQMEQREEDLLETRTRAAGEVTRQSMQMLGFGALLSLTILGIAAVIVIRTMRLADRRMRLGGAGRKWTGTALLYAFAAAAVALAVCLKWWLDRNVGPVPLFVTLYPAVLLVATVAGGGPGILATVLSAAAADYWFIEPIGQFSIAHGYDAVALGIFTSTGIFLSLLAERLARARQAEAVSAAQEQELALLNMGNLMALDPDHRIVRWSEGNHRLYGFDAEEARGKLTYELFQAHFDRPLEQIRGELFEKDRWEGEVTRRSKDGTQIPVAILWVVRRDERGRPLAILEVSTDITRQKTAEESLRQQTEELAQQNEELTRQAEELAQQSEELTQQNEELATQSGEIQALNTELDHREKMLQTLLDSARLPMGEQDVLEKICLAALEIIGLGADGAVICERRGDELHILAHAGFDGADVPRSWPVKGSFVEMMIEQNRTASLEDVALRPDLKLLPVTGHQPFGAILSSPLQLKGKPVGAVTIYSNTKQEWTAEQFRLIEWLAAQSSHALDALRLQAEVREGQRQNEFLAGIIERSSQPFVVGYPDGRLGLANNAFAQLTGYSREELQSIDWARTLTPPEWLKIELPKLEEQTRTGRPIHYEKEYIRKDGTRVPIELLVHLVKDAEGKPLYYYSFITDITARKQAEEELRQREQLLQNVIDGSTTPIFLKDLDGKFITINAALERMLGISREKLKGKTDYDIAPKEVADYWRTHDQQVTATGKAIQIEELADLPDGRHIFLANKFPLVNADGQTYGVGAISHDITERKRVEEALRESEARFRTLFDTMSEGFSINEIICDDKGKPCDLRYLAVNPAFERHTGVKAADIVGRTCLELFPQAEPEWFERYGKVALTGEPAHFESAFGPLGRWFEVSAYQTEPRRFAVVFFDITERKQAGEALRELNLSLERRVAERTAEVQQQADHLRALAVELSQAEQRERKRLAAILHDHIQQLLVAAQLQLGVVERADPGTVRAAVQGIHSIIAEAVAASRSLTVELSPPILHQSGLTAALTWLAARKEEKYLFKVHVRANSDAEPADPDVRALLFSSVQELLLNAVKHSGVREAQLIMRRSKENWTQIIVEDKGKGFDPSAISAHRGGGFGLFSIQQRLAYLGGRMEVDSAPGRGARFVLTIPIGQAAQKEAASAAPSAPPSEMARLRPKGRKISVLLVDDHRIMRQGLSSLLQFEEDIEVVGEAEDGRQAVALARQHVPDVIIMDVNMPVMNGIEATRVLSKELPQVKVIALSMHAERDTAEAMRQAGAVAYLTKGGPSEDLIAAIRACSQSRTTEP
jgi:PAS domain S-box-containing protein